MKNDFFHFSPDVDQASGVSTAAKTDNTKLVTGPTVYASPDGGTIDEPFEAIGP